MQIEIPHRVVCDAANCPMHNKCSRHAEYLLLKATEPYMLQLNKSLLTIGENGCQYLHIPKLVTAAYGFKVMYATVPKKNATNLWKRFPGDISRRQFYRLLSGEVALLPDEQEEILTFFKEMGADTSLGFDRYEDLTV